MNYRFLVTKRVKVSKRVKKYWPTHEPCYERVCLKIEIHEIHKMYEIHCLKIEIHLNATVAKYRNPRNPLTV